VYQLALINFKVRFTLTATPPLALSSAGAI
jgi:hypothetical protein